MGVVIARAKYRITAREAAAPVAETHASEEPVAAAAGSSEIIAVSPDGDDVPTVGATSPEPAPARVTIVTAPLPRMLIRRGLLAPSMISRVIVQKFRFGMPFCRQEVQLEANGIALDRGTMAPPSKTSARRSAPSCSPRSTALASRDGLLRIRKCYELDQTWAALPPTRRQNRQTVLRLLVNEFFDWVRAQNNSPLESAPSSTRLFGYAVRQQLALRRFLE